MNYYKLIKGDSFIGVATSKDMVRFQKKHNILLSCDETEAQYVVCNDVMYHANWMVPVNTSSLECERVEIIQISYDEFMLLKNKDSNDESIIFIEDIIEKKQDNIVVDNINLATIEYIKDRKIAELTKCCDNAIISGVDVIMGDGFEYHFSLTIQDQLNLSSICSMIERGETNIIYHADGEGYRKFTNQEILDIVNAAYSHRVYHTVYLSSLKNYVLSLDELDKVANVKYGDSIPEAFQSEALKEII